MMKNTKTRKYLCVLCVFVVLFSLPLAHAQQDEEVIRIQSELVSFEVSVRDAQGLPIRGLKAEDFVVYENGKRQQVSHLAALETPFDLVLIIDASISTQQEMELMRQAVRNFIGEIGTRDRISIIQFSRDVELLSDFTNDRAHLERALGRIGVYDETRTGSSVYDSLSLAVSRELLGSREGRKAVLMLSDGVDSSSILDYDSIKMSLDRSGAVFYFIELDTERFTEAGVVRERKDPERLQFSPKQLQKYYKAFQPKGSLINYTNHWLLTPAERREVNHGLYKLAHQEMLEVAERTGGRLFTAKRIQDLEGQYRAVIEELRTLYSIGYYPNRTGMGGGWRQIRVELKTPGATIHHRSGYWAK
jgi:VWFA-related protein